jgi:hypothetical protein
MEQRPALESIRLVSCQGTTLEFDDARFEVSYAGDTITITGDGENETRIRQKSGLFESESSIEGGVVLVEEKKGDLDYGRYLTVDWDDVSLPELKLSSPAKRIERRYEEGQAIELGLEDVSEYQVRYRDGVEASFTRREAGGFDFTFSTGFYGSFWQDPDGSYTLKFKGDRLDPSEEADRSQSKFIVSRSKYSGNLLLVLQDQATVVVK